MSAFGGLLRPRSTEHRATLQRSAMNAALPAVMPAPSTNQQAAASVASMAALATAGLIACGTRDDEESANP